MEGRPQVEADVNYVVATERGKKHKKLGVKILWLMPIHEIGYEKRKADGKLSIEDIKDEKENN